MIRPQSERKQTALEGPPIRRAEIYFVAENDPVTITGATNAAPISVTAAGHGYTTGDMVTIEGVGGNTAANGTWRITVTGTDTFTLNGSAGNGAYTGGGTVELEQPVLVKLVRWSGSGGFVPYGDPFAIGDRDTGGDVGDLIWIIWRSDAGAWYPLSGIGEHFQIIRGTALTDVVDTDEGFQIDTVAAYEEHAKAPVTPTWIAARPGGTTITTGDLVWAIYTETPVTITVEIDEIPTEVETNWVELPTSAGASTPPLRMFELTVAKAQGDATATGKWLDHDGDMVGDPVTLHDPGQQFYGRIADYISGERGFRGLALLQVDLAEDPEVPDPSRWVMIACEGFAETVVLQWAGSPDNLWQLDSFSGDQWEWRRPAADGGAITVSDPLSFPAADDGDKIIAHLLDPDTSPPTYQVRTVKGGEGGGKRVRGQVVGNITTAAASFTIDNLSNVFGNDTLPGSPLTVQQIYAQGYVDNQLTEAIYNEASGQWHNLPLPRLIGCHLSIAADGFLDVTAATLAGTGLSTETGAGGCLRLKTVGGVVGEGYCIQIQDADPDLIHFDAITAAAGTPATDRDLTKQQFFVHFASAAAPEDAKWKTAEDYAESGSAQVFLNDNGTWKWKTLTGYDTGTTQLFGHISGTWHAKTIAEWINLLSGYVGGNDQSIGHDGGGATLWQDDEECP